MNNPGSTPVDVFVPPQKTPLFIAATGGHFDAANGRAALFTLWKEAGRPVEIHVYDHAYGLASGAPVANRKGRLHDRSVAGSPVAE
jgi:hypothetical protein